MRHTFSICLFPHLVLAGLLFIGAPAMAIEVAPRIEDREIIERLTRLEEGQKHIIQYFEQRFDGVNKRIDDVNHRFDGVNKRIDDVNHRFDGVNNRIDDVNHRFDGVNHLFDGVNQRITDLQVSTDRQFEAVHLRISDLASTMQAMFLALIALIVALFSYIAWDRRTMFRPLKVKQDLMERRLEQVCTDVELIKTAMRTQPGGFPSSDRGAPNTSARDAQDLSNQAATIPGAVRA